MSLAPKTGGIFRVLLTKSEPELESRGSVAVAEAEARGGDGEARPGVRVVSLWDRATDGGFPEVKELKRRVRDEIAPGRGLGHNEKGGVREGEAKGGVRHEEAKGAVQEAKVEEAKGAVQEAKVEEDEEQRRKTVDVDEAREDGKCAACKE